MYVIGSRVSRTYYYSLCSIESIDDMLRAGSWWFMPCQERQDEKRPIQILIRYEYRKAYHIYQLLKYEEKHLSISHLILRVCTLHLVHSTFHVGRYVFNCRYLPTFSESNLLLSSSSSFHEKLPSRINTSLVIHNIWVCVLCLLCSRVVIIM